ncbi:MAG TPA: hypothetical protein DCQ28_07885 [Bacteroidetes bacterium]|nr:hypothetical protein [Bacteroidota bacterium]
MNIVLPNDFSDHAVYYADTDQKTCLKSAKNQRIYNKKRPGCVRDVQLTRTRYKEFSRFLIKIFLQIDR